MPYITLDVPPGIYRTGTDYKSKGRFFSANLWRWYAGESRPVGGWVQRSRGETAVEGAARAILSWRDNSNKAWAAIGTNSNLYAMTSGGFVYDITPDGFTAGAESATAAGAYGAGVYGAGIYGFGEPIEAVFVPATVWSLDTWGENLVGCTIADGIIYEWEPDVSNEAVAVSNAPTARAVVSTADRILMALGADGNPRRVQWSDQEDNTEWTSTATNYAGDFDLQTVGQSMCGRRVNGGTLILTDVDAWLASFIGQPFVYSFDKVGSDCGIISQGAIAVTDSQAIWMSQNGFWRFAGNVSPIVSDVHDYVFSDLNVDQASKITALHNSLFGEIWWFYPSSSSIENDRYVVFNYQEGHWNIGELSRLCATDRGAFSYPLMVDADGVTFDHERGLLRGGIEPFALSGPLEIGQGDQTVMVRQIIPDEENVGSVDVTFKTRIYPMGDETNYGPYPTTAKTDCRLSARQVSVEMRADADKDFRVGLFRFEVMQRGKR